MRRRLPAWVRPVVAVLLTCAFALVGNLLTSAVFVWVTAPGAVLLIALQAWIEVSHSRSVIERSVDEAAAGLAARVGKIWAEEAEARGLSSPAPVRVTWSSTGHPAANRAAVFCDTSGDTWENLPLCGE